MKLSHPEEFNLEVATKVLNQVTLHPESHLQRVAMNMCGSQGCIAGWACEFYEGSYLDLTPALGRMAAARIILGLEHHEADKLFSAVLGESAARRRLGSMIRQAEKYHACIARQVEREEEKRQHAHDRAARKQRWTTWALPKSRRTKTGVSPR